MAKSLFDDVLKAAQSAQQVAKNATSNQSLQSNRSTALPSQQNFSASALETNNTSSSNNASLKNTATKGVQGTSVSKSQSGINPTKIASSIFNPVKQTAGNASRWASLKASRGIAEDNGFSSLRANSVRVEDRQKKDTSGVVGNAAIDLAKIVSKNADVTFKNTVKAYNASTAAKNVADTAGALGKVQRLGDAHSNPSEDLFNSAESLRQQIQRRKEIDSAVKAGLADIVAPAVSNQVGNSASTVGDSAINVARFRQVQEALKDLGRPGNVTKLEEERNNADLDNYVKSLFSGQRITDKLKEVADVLSLRSASGDEGGHVNERVATGEESGLEAWRRLWKESGKQTKREPITVEVEKGGWAPKGLFPGDKVVTSNGTYTIVAVLSDGSYVTDAFGTRNKNGNEIANDKTSLGDYDSEHKFDDPTQERKVKNLNFFDRMEYMTEQAQKDYDKKLAKIRDDMGLVDSSEKEEKYWKDVDATINRADMLYASDPDAQRIGISRVGLLGSIYGLPGQEGEWTHDQYLAETYLTDRQMSELNYIYRKYGYAEARKYFKALKAKYLAPAYNEDQLKQLNERTGNAEQETEDYASKQRKAGTLSEALFYGDEAFRPKEQDHNYVYNSIESLSQNVLAPAAFAANVGQGVKNLFGIGEYEPISPNSYLNTEATVASQARENTSQNLQSAAQKNVTKLTGSKTAGKIAKKAAEIGYGAGMSTADMATLGALTGGFGGGTKFVTAAMSTASANNTLVNSLQRGATQEQAFTNAFINGALEYVSEQPAVESLGGMLVGRAAVTDVVSAFKALGRQAGTEALGEAFANVSQTYADDVIMGDKSNYALTVENYVKQGGMSKADAEKKAFQDLYLKDTLTAAVTGAVAGSMMVGGAIAKSQTQVGTSLQNAAKNYAADREGSIDELAEQYEAEGMEAEEARERATEEIDYQIENGAYVNDAASIVLDIAHSVKRANVGQKYKDTADKVLNGEKTGVIELANMKGALQNAAQKKAKSQMTSIYDYVGLKVPHRLSRALGKSTGHDDTGFANKKFTQAWVQKSAEILEKAQSYEEGDTETKRELRKYMDIADTLLYGQVLSDVGNTTAYVRAQVNYVLNGIEASAAGANVLSREESIYEESSQEPAEVSEQQATETETLRADESPATPDRAEQATLAPGSEQSTTITSGSEQNAALIGKKQGKTTSYHSSLESENASSLVEQAKEVSGIQDYDIIRVNENDKTVTFMKTDDFDGKTEPKVVSETTVDAQGNVVTEDYDNKIIVNKSKYVRPDYEGFDVAAQEEREKAWRNSGIRYDSQSLEDEKYFNETFGDVLNPKAEDDIIEDSTEDDTENTQEKEHGREVRRGKDSEGHGKRRSTHGKLGADEKGRKETETGGRQNTASVLESSAGRRGGSQIAERDYAAEAISTKRKIRGLGREAKTEAEKFVSVREPEKTPKEKMQEKAKEIVETAKEKQAQKEEDPDKQSNKITPNMTEEERFEILKDKALHLVENEDPSLNESELDALRRKYNSGAFDIFKKIKARFNVGDSKLSNRDVELEFSFSNSALNESVHKQKNSLVEYAEMLTVFDDIVENAIAVDCFEDRYRGTSREDPELSRVFVLIGAFKNQGGIVPIKILAKEFKRKDNTIRLAITAQKIKSDIMVQTYGTTHTFYTPSDFDNISLAELIKGINTEDADFLKYIPDGFLNTEQKSAKLLAISDEESYISQYEQGKNAREEEAKKEKSEPKPKEKQAQKEDTDVSGINRSLPEGSEPEGISGVQEERNPEDENQPAERVGGQRVDEAVPADEEAVHAEQPVREGQEDTDGRRRDSGNDRVSGDGTGERGAARNGNSRRFYIDRSVNPYQQTPARRAEANVKAIKLLKEVQESGRTKLTKEEKQTLAAFTGWGGLSGLVDSGRYADQLKQILTKDEYSAAAASSATAYYTPMEIIDAVYTIAKRLGLGQNARILEQFCGNGRFFGYMPQKLRTSSSITGVELDPISGSIAQLLYDDVDIRVQNYNQFDEKGFNLIVGNVPFDTNGVYDENYRAESNNTLHDYGITKGLAQLNPGGIMAVLTSSGTMDKEVKLGKKGDETVVTGGARLMMSERANLIGAIRFPEGTFTSTNVVTDLLVFQKKGEGVDDSLAQDFLKLGTMEVAKDPWSNSKSLPINEYFINHPEMILGTPYLTKNQFGKEVIGVRKSANQPKIDSLIEQLPKNIFNKALREQSERINEESAKAEKGSIEAKEKRSAGVINVIDGEVYTYDKGKWRPYQPMKKPAGKNAANKQPTLDTALLERIKALYTLEQARDALIEFERTSDDDSAVRSRIAEFEQKYDAFVKKYGVVNSRANENAYIMSPNFGKLQALEQRAEDEDGKTVWLKEAIFKERIAAPLALPTEVDNVSDALRASLNLKHNVDVGYMSELYGKSESEIVEELGERLFVNPEDGGYVLAEEYLSGNVREKLAEAQEAAKSNPDLLRNVHALMNVLPADLLPDQIDASLGASWIAPDVIKDFADWMFGNDQSEVSYNPISSKWSVSNPRNYSARNRWGTDHMSASELLEHALNSQTPEIKTKENGVNAKATDEAKAKVEEMQQAFRDWVWVDQERSERLQRVYNDTFNTYVERDVDISHVDQFIGQSSNIKLKPHQIKATLKALYQKATFFVHAVGSGKTFAMIASAQEMKRTGIANKPLMVVPNAKVSDFAADYRKLYPAANILVVGDKDFNTNTIDRTLAKIEQNNYDCIIMRMSSFDRFPVSAEALEEYKESELGKYRAALEAARTDGTNRDSLKEMESSIHRYEQKLNQMITEAVNNAYSIEVFLDKCGIDALLLDEAHNYKNLYFPTRQNVAGISKDKVTQKTTHLHVFTELMRKRGNRVVFASATPATNSLAEFFSMQRYIQSDLLEEAGVDNFDAWCSVFGDIETKTEMNVTGQKYKPKTRFSKLKNIPDLMRMMRQNFDFVSADDIDVPTPAADIWHIKSPASTLLYHVGNLIDQENMLKDVNGKHNTLANYTLALMMALDMRMARKVLIDEGIIPPNTTAEDLDFPDSKVNKAVENVLSRYRESNESKGTQIIFLDRGVPKSAKESENESEEEKEIQKKYDFDLYADIKTKLIRGGVPAEEIAFIHDFDSDVKKETLSRKMGRGDIRVLIGSTEKAGTGINVQRHIVAMHHIDAPQRPADLTQRNGRGVRQGNENEKIDICYYSTQNSYDSPKWEMLDRKSQGIEAVMKGDPNIREVDDSSLDDIFGGLSIAAANNPALFEMQDLKEKIARLEAQRSNLARRKNINDEIISKYPQRRKAAEALLNSYEAAKETVDAYTGDAAKVGRKSYDNLKEAARAAYDAYEKSSTQEKFEKRVIGQVNGVNVIAYKTWDSAVKNHFFVSLENIPWVKEKTVSVLDVKGNKVSSKGISPVNMFDALRTDLLEDYDEKYEEVSQRLTALEEEYRSASEDTIGEFAGKEELDAARQRYKELEESMLQTANDSVQSYDADALLAGDFSGRIASNEELVQHVGYIESGKERTEAKVLKAQEPKEQKNQRSAEKAKPGKKSEQYARKPPTKKELAQETAKKASEKQLAKLRSTNVIDESVPHTAEEQKIIDEYKAAVNPKLREFIEKIKNLKNVNVADKLHQKLTDITPQEAIDIEKLTGIDVTEFSRDIDGGQIVHILKRHGEKGKADQSMSDENDIARMEYILKNYDSIEVSEDYEGKYRNSDKSSALTLIYSKKVDGTYFVVEAVPDNKRKSLQIITCYAQKEKEPREWSMPKPRPDVRNVNTSALSENSISQEEERRQAENIAQDENEADENQYARKQERSAADDEGAQRSTPIRGNYNTQEATEDYGKTREAKEAIKKSERDAAKDIQSIIKEISGKFKINIFAKRYRKGKDALGFYDPNHQIIHSTNAQQLGNAIHELGHHLDNKHSLSYDDAVLDILRNAPGLYENLEKAGYSEGEMEGEVFADFIWHYVTLPDTAYEMGSYARGENFYDTFEKTLSKEDLKNLKHIRSMVLSFADKPVVQRSASTIKTRKQAKKANRGTFKDMKDRALVDFVDFTIPARDLDNALEAATGRKLSPTERLQLQVEFAGGASSVTNTILTEQLMTPQGEFVENSKSFWNILKELDKKVSKLDGMNRFKVTWREDFDLFLRAKHGIDWERRGKFTMSSDIAGNLAEDEHEANILAHQQTIDEMTQRYGDLFEKTSEEIYDWWDQFMRLWAVDTGLVDEENYEKWHEENPHYVPLFRDIDVRNVGRPRSGKSKNAVNDPIKYSNEHGSQRDVLSPIENLMVQANNIVTTYYRSQIGATIVKHWDSTDKDIQAAMGMFVAEIDPPQQVQRVHMEDIKDVLKNKTYERNWFKLSAEEKARIESLPEDQYLEEIARLADTDIIDAVINDVVQQFTPRKYGLNDDVVMAVADGKTRCFQILDPNFKKMMMALDPAKQGAFWQLTGKATRGFSAVTTSMNILFATSNAFRDIQHGMIMTEGKKWDPLNLTYIASWGRAFGEAFLNETGLKKTEMYQLMNAANGFESKYRPTADTLEQTIKGTVWKLNPMSVARGVLRGINNINEAVESAPRYVAYRRAYDSTEGSARDKWQAAWKAGREATVNFHKKGVNTRNLSSVIPFVGASIAGIKQYQELVASKESYTTKEGRLRLVRALVLQAIPAIALAFLYAGTDDDDEEKKEYDQFSSYLKNNYWMLKIKDTWIRVPKDRELSGMFATMAQYITTAALDPEKRSVDQMAEYLSYMLGLLLPAHEFTGRAILDAKNNKTWYGGTITSSKDENYLVADFYQEVYDAETSDIALALAKLIAKTPDSLQNKLGVIATPKAIDYIMDQLGGGVSDIVLPLFTPTQRAAGLLSSLKSRYTSNPDRSNRYVSEAYDIYETLKANHTKNENEDWWEGSEDAAWYNAFSKTISGSSAKNSDIVSMSDYYKEIRAIRENKELSYQEREEKINEAYSHIAQIAQNLVTAYHHREDGGEIAATYGEIEMPEGAAEVGFTQESYEKAYNSIKKSDELESRLALLQSTDLTEDQKTFVSERFAGMKYANIEKNYSDIVKQGITADEIKTAKETVSGYESDKAKALAVLSSLGYDAKSKAVIMAVTDVSSAETISKLKSAAAAGVTPEMLDEFKSLCSQLAKPGVKGYGASANTTANAAANQMEGLTANQRQCLIDLR